MQAVDRKDLHAEGEQTVGLQPTEVAQSINRSQERPLIDALQALGTNFNRVIRATSWESIRQTLALKSSLRVALHIGLSGLALIAAASDSITRFIKPAEATEAEQQVVLSQVFNLSARSYAEECKYSHVLNKPDQVIRDATTYWQIVYFSDIPESKDIATAPTYNDNLQKLADAAAESFNIFVGLPVRNKILSPVLVMNNPSTAYQSNIDIEKEVLARVPVQLGLHNGRREILGVAHVANQAFDARPYFGYDSSLRDTFSIVGNDALSYTSNYHIIGVAHEAKHTIYRDPTHNPNLESIMAEGIGSSDKQPKILDWAIDLYRLCTGAKFRAYLSAIFDGFIPINKP